MKTTWLIGWECKSSNVLSGPVLISRGLDLLGLSFEENKASEEEFKLTNCF